ncbi:MAG: hypothetical protein PVI21_04320 [Candidatus Woesebacteria bacterium]|jgi:hypothetical protein
MGIKCFTSARKIVDRAGVLRCPCDNDGQSGYTITEISLFLGISGLLILLVLMGSGATIQATRFTDSSRSLHAFIQKQYDNILNGVNTRNADIACDSGVIDSSPAKGDEVGTTNCLLMGRLVVLDQDSVVATAYSIIGVEPANPDYNQPDAELIHDFNPIIVRDIDTEQFTIPWGASVVGSKRSSDSTKVNAFAMIRSPRSTRVLFYTYQEPLTSYNLAELVNPNLAEDDNNFSSSTNTSNFCLRSADTFAVMSRIKIAGGQGQDAIGLSFDATTEDCNGN